MTLKRLFVLNAVIAGGYGLALLVAADPILDLYGITPNPEGVYMARWFGLELLAIGLTTWLGRDAAESAGGRAVARALTITYGIGVVLAVWGTLSGPFNALGWIAVALNLLLGSGFAYTQFIKPRSVTAGEPHPHSQA
jgi:Na+-driven multidrug efflux pump